MAEVMQLVIDTFSKQGIPETQNHIDEVFCPVWYVVVENGEIVGTIASWYENSEYHMGRFAVKESLRGKGIGTSLARYAIHELFSSGADEFVMDGRPATVKIFTKLGAEITGEPFRFYEGWSTPLKLEKKNMSV